nr:cytochrome c biogenesis protein ResB [Desulforamulus aquiferis]
MLTLNIVCTTGVRIRRLIGRDTTVPRVFNNQKDHRLISLGQCSPERVTSEAVGELKRLGFAVNLKEFEQGRLITGKKRAWVKFASPLLHLAVVLLVIGSVIGSMWGLKGYYPIEVPGRADLTKDGFPFDLRVNEFNIEYYEDGTPRQYTSSLAIIKGEGVEDTRDIAVNRPLKQQGVKVYQSTYGYNLEGSIKRGDETAPFKVEEGDLIFLGGPAHLAMEVQWPRYLVYSQGIPFSMGIAELNEPLNILNMEVTFKERIPFTGLEVKSDPDCL